MLIHLKSFLKSCQNVETATLLQPCQPGEQTTCIHTSDMGGNREQNFLYQICVLDYQKLRFLLPKSILWQLKTPNLHSAIVILAIKNSCFWQSLMINL